MPTTVAGRWLFADQLGPHFHHDADGPVLLVESAAVFRRRPFHRRKAHLVLSALRHLAAELGGRAVHVRAETYRQGLAQARERGLTGRLSVCAPTSRAARRLVDALAAEGEVQVLPARGYAVQEEQFERWAQRRGRRRLLMEDFYRDVRRLHTLLMEPDGEPAAGVWNTDHDNRRPPPRGARRLADAVELADPWWPQEDEIDAGVRRDLDRWVAEGVPLVGQDGPREMAVTRGEAEQALDHFVQHRLAAFGPHEDAMLAHDRWMAHSVLSVPLNLGLLDPVEVARAAEQAYRAGAVPLASAEGFVRQVVGWRDYVWHLYWHLGEDYRGRNELDARAGLPRWFAELDPDRQVQANCLSDVLAGVREHGWVHHIPRLMVLGNWAMQHGYDPAELTGWFHTRFVDGYDWVMVPNVVGMSQHADGGVMATKPYAGGGAYIDRMSDYCKGCRYDPRRRVGERACPFTAGYWAFLHRHRDVFAANPRMARAVKGLDRLGDLEELLEAEAERGDQAP